MIEIERKFLVDKESWQRYKLKHQLTHTEIKQGYLFNNQTITARVRSKIEADTNKESGFLTLKGPANGISRAEFEFYIPTEDVQEILSTFCSSFINKRRFTFDYLGKTWEVDEFISPNPNLILAEIELDSENEEFEFPCFVTTDVSKDPAYYNVNMLKVKKGAEK